MCTTCICIDSVQQILCFVTGAHNLLPFVEGGSLNFFSNIGTYYLVPYLARSICCNVWQTCCTLCFSILWQSSPARPRLFLEIEVHHRCRPAWATAANAIATHSRHCWVIPSLQRTSNNTPWRRLNFVRHRWWPPPVDQTQKALPHLLLEKTKRRRKSECRVPWVSIKSKKKNKRTDRTLFTMESAKVLQVLHV